MDKQAQTGKLYIVATPIGNPKDITLRALSVLATVDGIICEEYRQGSRLLNQLGIENELITLNEHNEVQEVENIIQRLRNGAHLAIISDAGTPVFADPGGFLLEKIYQLNIPLTSIPGPGSLMTALSLCDFSIEQFIFAGFPPQKSPDRENFLKKYQGAKIPVILMDTPYRLTKLLNEVQDLFGMTQDILLACDLTQKTEAIFRGQIGTILPKITGRKMEFILILNLNPRKRLHHHG